MRIRVDERRDAYGDVEEGTGGWYESSKVKLRVEESQEWDGNNMRGTCSGLQTSRETLTLTAGGRWVLHHDASSEFNGPDRRWFLTDDEAREWLIKSEDHDEVLEKYFPELPEEAGPPGRPVTVGGKPTPIKLGEQRQQRIDDWAAERGIDSRAEAVRQLVDLALEHLLTGNRTAAS